MEDNTSPDLQKNKLLRLGHQTCPSCNTRVYKRAIFWLAEPAGPLASLASLALLAASEASFWGGDGDKRVLVKGCYTEKGPWVHIRVNGQDRIAYLKAGKMEEKKKRKRKGK